MRARYKLILVISVVLILFGASQIKMPSSDSTPRTRKLFIGQKIWALAGYSDLWVLTEIRNDTLVIVHNYRDGLNDFQYYIYYPKKIGVTLYLDKEYKLVSFGESWIELEESFKG